MNHAAPGALRRRLIAAGSLAAVAVRRVQRLHVVVTHGRHPRHRGGQGLALVEELVPAARRALQRLRRRRIGPCASCSAAPRASGQA